ncbi:MAG: hypothetical protein IJU19_05525 [Bacteroidales bacterium]|nr:hypothetical protein [Bacteroidales bacterium]
MVGYIILLVVLLTLFVVLPLGVVAMVLSIVYNRRERELRGEAEAHRKILESTYDRIWKEVKTRCRLTEQHRRSFSGVYPNLIDQEMDDEIMLNYILDHNLDFDPSEYAVLKANIADDRQRFVLHQRRMLTVLDEHNRLLENKIAYRLLKNKTLIKYVPVETNYERWGIPL